MQEISYLIHSKNLLLSTSFSAVEDDIRINSKKTNNLSSLFVDCGFVDQIINKYRKYKSRMKS